MKNGQAAQDRLFLRLRGLYCKAAGFETTDPDKIREHIRALKPSDRLPELYRIYGDVGELSRELDMVLCSWNLQQDGDPEAAELRRRYAWMQDFLPPILDTEEEPYLRRINFQLRDSRQEPVSELIRQIRETDRWLMIVRDTVEAAVEPLLEPAEIGKGFQERIKRARRKHPPEDYSKTVIEIHEKYPRWSFNLVARRAGELLKVDPRTIKRYVPRKPW